MSTTHALPPLPALDAEAFRRTLAGLQDPDDSSDFKPADFKGEAAMFCVVLADCFNRDVLDAITLWDRIATGIAAACAKVDDGDLDRFICLCLEHVKADHARVASNERASAWIANVTEAGESWRLGFVRYLQTHSYAAVIHGRAGWEQHKESRKSLNTPNPARAEEAIGAA